MTGELSKNTGTPTRRGFLKGLSFGAAGAALGAFGFSGCAAKTVQTGKSGQHRRLTARLGASPVTFTTSKDQREASFQALKPLQRDIERAVGNKQVIIKINSGQVREDWWLNATDPKFVRGILDFLKPWYDREVIIAESTAAGAQSTMTGFENYGFMPLKKEYRVRFVDLNDEPSTTLWIQNENRHPLGVTVIDTFIDPDIYLISATRLKTHNCVVATLSLKNVVMAAPKNHYRQAEASDRNEKRKMHSGGYRGLSYNLFLLATMGVQPDLAVLDGVVGMEGDGPVSGTPVEQGVALASTDWLAADRLGVELMGMDYDEVKYLHWCAEAGMGQDDLSNIRVIGPDYRQHITKYTLHKNIDKQREWIREDYGG